MRTLDILDRFLLDENWHERQSHYASDALACRRQVWYKWMEEPPSEPDDPSGALKMALGDSVEYLIRDALRWAVKKGELKKVRFSVRKRQRIKGLAYPVGMKLDFLATDEDGREIIGEVKSSYGRGVSYVVQAGKPKDEHLMQCGLYLAFYKPIEVDYVLIGRDNGYRTEMTLELDQPFVVGGDAQVLVNGKPTGVKPARAIERFREIEELIEEREEPARDFMAAIKNGQITEFQHKGVKYRSDWQCSYCAWSSKCWAPKIVEYQQGNNADELEAHREGKAAGDDT